MDDFVNQICTNYGLYELKGLFALSAILSPYLPGIERGGASGRHKMSFTNFLLLGLCEQLGTEALLPVF